MSAHTPTPWHIGMKPGPMIYGPKGEQVTDMRSEMLMPDENTANAELIVRAVNSHAELLAALELMVLEFGDVRQNTPQTAVDDARRCALEQARAAIAKAEGTT